MLTITENDSTLRAIDFLSDPMRIKWEDFDVDENTYSIEELENKKIFLKGVSSYLNIDVGNIDTIISEIKTRYAAKGIKWQYAIDKSWIRKNCPPSQKRTHRENCYNFCIALDMDFNQTINFMFKYFQIMPFYYKDRTDAIYYYCIRHNKSYKEITQMLDLAKTFPATNNETAHTEYIGRKISEIDNDEEFLNYLKNFCYDKEHWFATSRCIALKLIKECKSLAGVKSNSKLSKAITGYSNQVDGRADKGISKSSLPKNFTKLFPNDLTFDNIENHPEKVSDEAYRRALILLCFYKYYKAQDNANTKAHKKMSEKDVTDSLNDFCKECNSILAECGYIQLYPFNAFDLYIRYFVNSENPIHEMKKFIDHRYFYEFDEE